MSSRDEEKRRTRRLNRRTYVALTTASATGLSLLSGCAGGDDTTEEPSGDRELPEGVSREEFESGPVPEAYTTAISLGGEQRNPDELSAKADVTFSEYDEAQENSAHRPGRCCANCADFIPDKNGDAFGACAEVEGYVDGEDWCTIYESLPEPEIPEGMTEAELATAEVPEAYRTASSQAGEARDPEDLLSQADVNLTESVEAIEDGQAPPGQSCGNCAEFIPDQNGDSWGACARVAGYVAAEDWCTVWEHVTEER